MVWIVVLGALVNVAGSSVYIWRTAKGLTKPNRVTFFMWGLAPLIAFAAALSEGVGWASLTILVSGLIPASAFIATFFNKNAYWKLGRFDYVCGAFSLLALLLWWMTENAATAILFAILSDGVATVPTVIKAWRFPETEYWTGYAAAIVSALSSFFVIETFTFVSLAFPVYLILACGAILFSIYHKKFI